MYVGSNYELYLQSLSAFIIIALIFIPILKWGFTSKSDRAEKKRKRELKRDLARLKRK
jgi:hypothetical protein